MEFKDYIKQLRKNRKMSIRKLSLISGISHSYLSQIENGNRGIPAPEYLKKLAGPLNVSYEDLLEKAGYIQKVKPSQDLLDLIAANEQGDPAAIAKLNRILNEDNEEIELSKILDHPYVTFDGIHLTDQDKQRIKDFLTGFILGRK